MIAHFQGGPLDGLEHELAAVPGGASRVVAIENPLGAPTVIYGPNLAHLHAPVLGEPAQHVYEFAGVIEDPQRFAVTPTAARYGYRGPFPAEVAPTGGPGPYYEGPVMLPCHAGRTDREAGCLVPRGVVVLELREDDPTDLDVIACAHMCPHLGCGRLFVIHEADQ